MKKIAVVTGASSGMGQKFCIKLDTIGADEIWGIALESEGLDQTEQMLKTPMRKFPLDLSKDESLKVIEDALKESDVEIVWLLCASGFCKIGRYDEIPLAQTLGMIDVNCRALVAVTQLCLPYMKEGARITEIASSAGFQPLPYINVYSATKAFVLNYSRALNVELKNRKISVTCVCPYWTNTPFIKKAEEQSKAINYIKLYNPDDVVEKAFKDTLKRKKISICGCFARFYTGLSRCLPKNQVMRIWIRQQKFNKKYKNK